MDVRQYGISETFMGNFVRGGSDPDRGGVVWYLMFYGAQRDYTGGMLVQISDMMRGAV